MADAMFLTLWYAGGRLTTRATKGGAAGAAYLPDVQLSAPSLGACPAVHRPGASREPITSAVKPPRAGRHAEMQTVWRCEPAVAPSLGRRRNGHAAGLALLRRLQRFPNDCLRTLYSTGSIFTAACKRGTQGHSGPD